MAEQADEGPDALHRQAQQAVLSGLRGGDDIHNLINAVAPHHVVGHFAPDAAMLEVAVSALELACPAGTETLVYEGLQERCLPEVTFTGRVGHRNIQYALYGAACMRRTAAGFASRRRLVAVPVVDLRGLRRSDLRASG